MRQLLTAGEDMEWLSSIVSDGHKEIWGSRMAEYVRRGSELTLIFHGQSRIENHDTLLYLDFSRSWQRKMDKEQRTELVDWNCRRRGRQPDRLADKPNMKQIASRVSGPRYMQRRGRAVPDPERRVSQSTTTRTRTRTHLHACTSPAAGLNRNRPGHDST